MKGLALEYIIRIVILLVVIFVVINLIKNFAGGTKKWFRGIVCTIFKCPKTKEKFPLRVTKDYFTSSEIANYIVSCLESMSSLPEAEQEDKDCYILVAKKGFQANKGSVLLAIPPELRGRVNIEASFTRDLVIIQFKDIGNRVIVSD